jgi:hypothetical protein
MTRPRPARARPIVRGAGLTVAALAGLIALAGCTGPSHEEPTPHASGSYAGLPSGVVPPESVPADVPNDPAARPNVVIDACVATDEGWSASGSALNPDAAATTFTITAFFTTEAGTVIGYADTTTEVPASGTTRWAAQADFVAPADTRCVLRGVASS